MDAQVSSSFIYAVLAGLFAVLIFIYYQKLTFQKKKRHPLYYAGVFFIVSNIIYNTTSPESINSQMTLKNVFSPVVCEMKTGQPSF